MIKMPKLYPKLQDFVEKLPQQFTNISNIRRPSFEYIATEIHQVLQTQGKADLMFVCTHNSRRSHTSQIWAQTAAYYYDIPGIRCFSGGTEATAFYKTAVQVLRDAGFVIEAQNANQPVTTNPIYKVQFADDAPSFKVFSKKYEDAPNPKRNFIAIVNCSQADESCPVIEGAQHRFALLFQDPKKYDNTEFEKIKYAERCLQIGCEVFYLFDLLKKMQ